MISTAAPDGSKLEEPKLFISMPRSPSARRRVGRSKSQFFDSRSTAAWSEPAAVPVRATGSFTGGRSVGGGSSIRSWARGLGLAASHREPSAELAAAIAAGDPAVSGVAGVMGNMLLRQASVGSGEARTGAEDWVDAEEENELQQQQQQLPLANVMEEEQQGYHYQQQQQPFEAQAEEEDSTGLFKHGSMMVLDGQALGLGVEQDGPFRVGVMDCSDEEEDESEESEEWWCSDLTGVVVAEIMTTPLAVITQETDAQIARTLMTQHELNSLLVDCGPATEPGFITRRDFFKVPLKKKTSKKKKLLVKDLMSHPVVSVEVGMAIEEAAASMQLQGVTRAVVIDSQIKDPENHLGHYVGLITDASIFRCLGLHADNDNSSQEDVDEALLMLGSRAASALTQGSLIDRLASSRTVNSEASEASSRATVATAEDEPTARAALGAGQQQQLVCRLGSGGNPGSSSSTSAGTPCAAVQGSNSSSSMQGQSRQSEQQQEVEVAAIGADGDATVEREISFASATSGISSMVSGSGLSAYSLASSTAPDAMTRFRSVVSLWELDFNEIQMIKKIGEGSFGEVMLGNFRGTKVRGSGVVLSGSGRACLTYAL
jgi:CBS domain-containing protein